MRSPINLRLVVSEDAALRRNERGATATEYAILVAMIALVIIAGAAFFGSQLGSWFNDFGNSVSTGF